MSLPGISGTYGDGVRISARDDSLVTTFEQEIFRCPTSALLRSDLRSACKRK